MRSSSLEPWGLRPEADLILSSLADFSGEGRSDRIRNCLREDLDWEHIVRTVEWNRIVPLFDTALRNVPEAAIPCAAKDRLEQSSRQVQLYNLACVQELRELLHVLASHGIDAFPYKGVALGATLYKNVGLREFNDIDLMVRRKDVARVNELLRHRGYVALRAYEEQGCEQEFTSPGPLRRLEIHWEFLPQRMAQGFTVQDYWDRLLPTQIADFEVQSLGPEDLLLVLCIHGGEKHAWNRLQQIADIRWILEVHPDLEWERIWRSAAAIGREPTLLLGLLLPWVLLEAPLSPAIAARCAQHPATIARAAMLWNRLFDPCVGMPRFADWRKYVRELAIRCELEAGTSESKTSLLRYLRTIMTPGFSDRNNLRAPGAFSFLAYVNRPWRLLRRHGIDVLKRI